MFGRSGRLLIALSLAVPSIVSAQSFQYAPSAGQYRITTKQKGAREAMGQKQEFEATDNRLLSVTVAPQSKDTLAVTIVIDSINAIGPMGAPPPGFDKFNGVKIAAKVAPYGALYSAIGPKDDSIMGGTQLTDDMSRFLPRIRKPLAVGAAWVDTLTGKINQGGVDIDRRVIGRYQVVGDTTIGAEKAWKIARETVTSVTGSGTTQGQPVTMEGTANGKATLWVTQKGVFVGSQNEDQSNVKIVLAANGLEIGLTTTTNQTVEKVK